MNKSESYQNWALTELMNYVKSVAEVETNVSYKPPKQVVPVNKDENYQNWALAELMNYVKSVAEVETNVSYCNLPQVVPDRNKFIEAEVTTIATETPPQNNCSLRLGEVILPSNSTNLMVLINHLHLSNSKLVNQVAHLSSMIAQLQQKLETYQSQFQKAASRLEEQNKELAANYQTIQTQTSLIEQLTCELAIANQLMAQVQADCNEQSYQLSAEKDNCRDLRTRLNREQQHSLQLKVALEKCLEVPVASYQLADDNGVSKASKVEEATSAAKTLPIKPWTTQTRSGGNPIDLSWDCQNYQNQSNVDIEEIQDFQPIVAENEIASPEHLELFSSIMVREELASVALTDIDEKQVASPIEINQVNTYVQPPSPLVYPSRPPKGRKSLASIELPSFC